MRATAELLIHAFFTLLSLCKPGGTLSIVAENIALRQQLIVLNRTRKRSPPLTTHDKILFGFLAKLVKRTRLQKIAITLKPATILKFHKALVKRKYKLLYSNNHTKTGRKGPSQELVELVIDIKRKNPGFGYRRIAMQIYQSFDISISCFAVGRILRNHFLPNPTGSNNGPSWLTFIGHMKDSLWSVDLFRCESLNLKSHWVMLVIDQFSRRIIGFAVNSGDCDGIAYCRMFNSIISAQPVLPKYLSSDNAPIFMFHRWKANLRVLDIEEIKSVPHTPLSHPFIERTIGSVRREFLDHTLFWNQQDLNKKLNQYKEYFNATRAHCSLEQLTPNQQADETRDGQRIAEIPAYRWQSHCKGLFQIPIAA